MSELLSYKTFSGERYKLISKSGNKRTAQEYAQRWKAKGYLARVVRVNLAGWKWGIYIRKA